MNKSIKDYPFVVIFIIVIFVVFLSQSFPNDSKINILNLFRPALKLISGTFFMLRDTVSYRDAMVENKILHENIDNLENRIVELQEAELENKRLRGLVGFIESRGRKFIPARLIAKDPMVSRQVVIIDKGKKDGVRKGMAVISGKGFVGRVRECGWSISRVLLITDSDSVLSGIVQRTRDEGAVAGNGQAGLIVKYLDISCDVMQGDKVITSGVGHVSEKGILIGDVVSVTQDNSGLYKNAVVRPAVDIMKLEEVLVIR